MLVVCRWDDIEDRKEAEQRLRNENVALREEILRHRCSRRSSEILPLCKRAFSHIQGRPTDSSVLITGETGTAGTGGPRHSQAFPAARNAHL